MADLFDVVADGTRRSILEHLRDDDPRGAGLKVGELVAALEVSQPTVSKHLKVLREAGLVSVREEGQSRRYRLEPEGLDGMGSWLAPFVGGDTAVGGDAGDGDAAGGAAARAAADAAAATVYGAWAGVEVGDRVGRTAADAAHRAQRALESAQDRWRGARRRVGRGVGRRLPGWARRD
ncbi:MAG: winged helix-turn-helix transcriptional regulator [Actinomycetales bacterium]|nr:winged helix-turn-helix transcriptional regulator [Actinomycetales bacterium]